MSSAAHLEFFGKTESREEQSYLYMLSVKTQYAGIEIHKLFIQLLKYLSARYFVNFQLKDDGMYWETGDEKLLNNIFQQYTDLIDSFASSLEIFPVQAGESFIAYFKRLLQQIQDRKKE